MDWPTCLSRYSDLNDEGIEAAKGEAMARAISPYVRTLTDMIGYAINLSGGRAKLREIYATVKRIRPKTPDASIRSDLYRGIDKGLFRRFPDGTYGRGETIPLEFPLDNLSMSGLIAEDKLLTPYTPLEAELEEAFIKNYRRVFDSTALYIPIKKLVGQSLRKVTDGLMLDLDEKGRGRFWIVELELSTHDLESHVQAQVLGFLRALDDEKTLRKLVGIAHEYIARVTGIDGEDEGWDITFFEGQQKKMYPRTLEPYQHLDAVFHQNSGVIIVIDEVTNELREIVESISKLRPVRVVEFKSFKDDGKKAYTFSHVDVRISS